MKNNSTSVSYLNDIRSHEPRHDWSESSLCYGHFSVIHPGHLRYFQTARKHSSRLLVAIESDESLLQKHQGNWYPELERARAVAALEIVDHVIILVGGGLEDLVIQIRPKTLVLGREFEHKRSNEVSDAVSLVLGYGGEVYFEAGESQYASTDLLFGRQDDLERDRWMRFQTVLRDNRINLKNALDRILNNPSPRLLVIGDTILDKYIACDPVGMSNEAPVVVVKELETREFIGGASIVAAHVVSLGSECVYLSVVGDDDEADLVEKKLVESRVINHLVRDNSRPTTNKIRYMVDNQKLFRVSRLKEHSLSKTVEEIVIKKIVELVPSLQGIVISDFVYGVITPKILSVITKVSKEYGIPVFGDLQCSSQIGNVSKFKECMLICPTEREARVAMGNQDDSVEFVANLLIEKTRSHNLILKLGAEGLIAYAQDSRSDFVNRHYFPALVPNPVDVAGAGDSMLAAVAVSLTQGLSLFEAAALGSCVSAIAVQTVGNIPVEIGDLKRFISRMENLI